MKRGGWHQMGYNSQKMIDEALANGCGVGAILSPRYLNYDATQKYAAKYRDSGASVLLDPEFYVPGTEVGKVHTYPSAELRSSVSEFLKISDADIEELSNAIEQENKAIGATAVLAPAVPYEAARDDLVELNRRLFVAAKQVGDAIGIPTYATVVVGSTATTPELVSEMLSGPTQLDADGWYFHYEFSEGRLPNNENEIYSFCIAGLTLACTDKPILNSSVGPLSILSFAIGASATAVTFRQNLWGFERAKWEAPPESGGGGGAPARFFSASLWGTIVQPDEVSLLPAELREAVLTHTEHSAPVAAAPLLPWKKWDSYKHMVQILIDTANSHAALKNSRGAATAASAMLMRACKLHADIAKAGYRLKDETDSYQAPWLNALQRVIEDRKDDYAWLRALGR